VPQPTQQHNTLSSVKSITSLSLETSEAFCFQTAVFWVIIILSGVRLSPLGTAATVWPIVLAPDDGDCGAIAGMKIGKGNRSTRRKANPALLCPPQIPHDQTPYRTRAAAVGSQRLTA
jgi:hypothetical protein